MTTKHIILLTFTCLSGFIQMNAMDQNKKQMVITNKSTKRPFIPHANAYKPRNYYYMVAQPMTPEQFNKIHQEVHARKTKEEKQAEQDRQNIDKMEKLIQSPDITEKQRNNFRGILQLNPEERPIIAELVLSQYERTLKKQKSVPTEQPKSVAKATPKPITTSMPAYMPVALIEIDKSSYYTKTPEDFLMDPTGLKK